MGEPLSSKRLLLWSRWVAAWLWEPKLLWLTLMTIVTSGYLVFGPICNESTIRLTGLGLQILGMITVIIGIRSTGELFGRPTLIEAAKAWGKRYPSYQPRIVSTSFTAKGTGSISARSAVRAGLPPSPTLEDRVRTAERNIEFLRQEISEAQEKIDETERKLTTEMNAERGKSHEELNQVKKKLEEAHTGGLYVATMGITWLFIGVCLSTASAELVTACS